MVLNGGVANIHWWTSHFLFILLYLILQLYINKWDIFWREGQFSFSKQQNQKKKKRGQLSHLFTHNLLFRSCSPRPPSLQAAATVRHWAALARETQLEKQPWFWTEKNNGLGCMTRMGEYIYIYYKTHTHSKIEQHLGKEKHIRFSWYTFQNIACTSIVVCSRVVGWRVAGHVLVAHTTVGIQWNENLNESLRLQDTALPVVIGHFDI